VTPPASDGAAAHGRAGATAARGRTSGQRRKLSATREGKVFVFVTIGLGFAAVNTGTNLMYLVFGFMLSLIVLSGVISEHTLRRLGVARGLPSRAFVAQPVLIDIVLTNTKPSLPSYSVDVEELARDLAPEGKGPRCYFLKVPPASEAVAQHRRTFTARGRAQLGLLRVSTRFPFALFEKWCEVPSPDELLVFPRPRPVSLPRGLLRAEGDGQGTARGRGVETRELRDYRTGDEARSVHWRRTAALGRTIVRELARDATTAVTLLLDNHVPAGDADAAARFERDVERAVYLVARVVERGGSVEVCARGTSSPVLVPGSSDAALLTFLALVQPASEPVPYVRARLASTVVELAALVDLPDPEPRAAEVAWAS
jgi:uncharacterized protein (DUF58 family)